MASPKIERSYFTTEALDNSREKILAWRESCGFIFDYQPKCSEDDPRFNARIESFNYGSLITSVCQSKGASWRRSPVDAAHNGVDHYLVQFYMDGHGHFSGDSDDGDFRSGDILVLDATRQTHSVTSDFRNFTLWVPRDIMEQGTPDPGSLHGAILPSEQPTNTLLRSHLMMVHENAARMSVEQGEQLTKPTLDLLFSALDGRMDSQEHFQHTRHAAQQLAVKRFIRKNIDSPDLTADTIANAVNVSRATLYRLCEPLGGINHYIREQRLRCVLSALADPRLDHLPIAQIASYWRFDEPSSFNRMFRKAFGVTPGDARSYRITPPTQESVLDAQEERIGDRKYESWLTGMVA